MGKSPSPKSIGKERTNRVPEAFSLFCTYKNKGRSCLPDRVASRQSGRAVKSATKEWGLRSGSSCRIGTKKICLRWSSSAILARLALMASLEARARRRGRSERMCAFAAILLSADYSLCILDRYLSYPALNIDDAHYDSYRTDDYECDSDP